MGTSAVPSIGPIGKTKSSVPSLSRSTFWLKGIRNGGGGEAGPGEYTMAHRAAVAVRQTSASRAFRACCFIGGLGFASDG
jgi:hypothetical protein